MSMHCPINYMKISITNLQVIVDKYLDFTTSLARLNI